MIVKLKYIQLANSKCYQVPSNWAGQIGMCFDELTAAQNGAALDPDCTGYNQANNPVCVTDNTCFIAITAVSYSSNHVNASVLSQGTSGALEYAVNELFWYTNPSEIAGLVPGEYTLHVRDSVTNTCKSQRGFIVS